MLLAVALLAQPDLEDPIDVALRLEQEGMSPARAERLAVFVPVALAHAVLGPLGLRVRGSFALAGPDGRPGMSHRLSSIPEYADTASLAAWLLADAEHGDAARSAAGWSAQAAAVAEHLEGGRQLRNLREEELVLFLAHPLP